MKMLSPDRRSNFLQRTSSKIQSGQLLISRANSKSSLRLKSTSKQSSRCGDLSSERISINEVKFKSGNLKNPFFSKSRTSVQKKSREGLKLNIRRRSGTSEKSLLHNKQSYSRHDILSQVSKVLDFGSKKNRRKNYLGIQKPSQQNITSAKATKLDDRRPSKPYSPLDSSNPLKKQFGFDSKKKSEMLQNFASKAHGGINYKMNILKGFQTKKKTDRVPQEKFKFINSSKFSNMLMNKRQASLLQNSIGNLFKGSSKQFSTYNKPQSAIYKKLNTSKSEKEPIRNYSPEIAKITKIEEKNKIEKKMTFFEII